MSNGLYNFGREGFLDGSIDWDTDDIDIGFYIPSILYSGGITETNAKFVDEITAVDGVFRLTTHLSGKTKIDGVADANDVTIPSGFFAGFDGFSLGEFVLMKWTGSGASSRLIAHFDAGVGLPWVINQGIFTIVWPDSSSKIFKL